MIKKNYSELFEFTSAQLDRLKKEYEPMRGKTISFANSRKLNAMMDRLSKDMLVKLANADVPFVSTSAASKLVMKHGMKFTDFKLNMSEADDLQCEACWTGYKQVGMKKKGDRMVPNCVQEDIQEADLSKSQVKMVHKSADKLDKKDFMKRYGKDGDSVRYATATNMVKKKLGIEEQRVKNSPEVAAAIRQYIAQRPFIDNKKDYEELMRLATKDMGMFNARLNRMTDQTKSGVKSALSKKGLSSHLVNEKEPKGDEKMNESYKDKFNATMKDFGINSLGDLKSDEEKKKFFKAVDAKHDAKDEELEEGLTPAQKKLPPGLQKAILKKQGGKDEGAMKRGSNLDTYKPKPKKEEIEEMGSMNAQYEMMKKEMMKKVEMMKAEKDPEQMEMMKKEMMKEMQKMPEMMKQEMMKKMEMAMKEGFASDAQRKAAFASGYKEKGKDKKEMMNAMKMNAMKMPIKAMYKKEMKTGDDDLSPMNNMKMNAMMKDPHKSKEEDPKRDMNAMYMKSDVRADVKNGGGADMAKVKDAPKMQTAMKKINAMYKQEKYLPVKEGSIQDTIAQMYVKEAEEMNFKGGDIEKMIVDYLKKGGTITKLPPALAKGMKPSDMEKHKLGKKGPMNAMYKMKEVREFVSTYNQHFLTNYKAEELMIERRYMVTDYYFSDMGGQVGLSVVVDAANEDQAEKKAEPKIEKLRNSSLARRMRVDDPTGDLMDIDPTTRPLNYTDIDKDSRP